MRAARKTGLGKEKISAAGPAAKADVRRSRLQFIQDAADGGGGGAFLLCGETGCFALRCVYHMAAEEKDVAGSNKRLVSLGRKKEIVFIRLRHLVLPYLSVKDLARSMECRSR